MVGAGASNATIGSSMILQTYHELMINCYLLIHESSYRQAVEAVGECLPEPDVVPPFAFIVEAIDAVDGRALVVPPEEEKILWVFHLQHEAVPELSIPMF